jgi:hypothetical protein
MPLTRASNHAAAIEVVRQWCGVKVRVALTGIYSVTGSSACSALTELSNSWLHNAPGTIDRF